MLNIVCSKVLWESSWLLNMPKLLSSYYGLFILAILAQSKHLLKKKKSQHDFTDHTLFLFQAPALRLSWANEPGCGQMCQGLKGRNHGHSHFQLSAASHTGREHCWFSFHWALVKGGELEPCFSSHTVLYVLARKWDITKYGLQGSSRTFSAWLSAKRSELFRNHKAIIFAWDFGEVVCVCALRSTQAATPMSPQKTEFTV